jgi:hemolysin III
MYHGERFNGYTHLAGTFLATAGAVVLVADAVQKADPTRLVSFAIYGATLCLLYLASTLYHSTRGALKRLFRKLDHCSIYLVIAGTYTPFALLKLEGPWGAWLLAAVWALALMGVLQEIWFAKGMRPTSLAIYLAMGLLAVFASLPLVEAHTLEAFKWLAGGGLVYTAGMAFYLLDERFAHWHGIWHLFVMGGSGIHYAGILLFIA